MVNEDRPAEPLLEIEDLHVTYGGAVRALEGLSLTVRTGEIVALLGVNGAGKTSTLRAVTGLLPYNGGLRTSGTIRFEGRALDGLDSTRRVKRGISMVMEGRRVFGDLTVEENLRAASFTRPSAEYTESRERIYDQFPILRKRHKQLAGLMSGGEQQMLAIGRALMQKPRLLLLDEPSLGLAPLIVDQIKEIILDINRQGTSILLIEQNAAMGLSASHYSYILEGKKVVREGAGSALLADPSIREIYLGIGDEGRKSYRTAVGAGIADGTGAS